ncbi:hypothetical protein KIN20_012639 [Parelaphostrongylus tenuis]|uniref:Uncharacterized protein n=1 Tax=Parelaphostrongylus tenuis TaxID=148309 RepID=A0AAD5MEG4_PARTN|nr:hypothetical protein KIN20_012639 [Parelaphostrongylus tenuis]
MKRSPPVFTPAGDPVNDDSSQDENSQIRGLEEDRAFIITKKLMFLRDQNRTTISHHIQEKNPRMEE